MTARAEPQEQEGAQPPRPVTEFPLAPGDAPTSFADLTIVEMPLLPPDAPADDEQPSPLAECTIELVPLNPLDLLVDGAG